MNYTTVLEIIALVAMALVLKRLLATPGLPLPPGPPRDFLIGNLRNFPKTDFPRVFTEWETLYGDVVYTNVFGVSTVVLNSRRSIEDLMVERAPRYQSRSVMVMTGKHCGWEWVAGFKPAGPQVIEDRRILLFGLGPTTVKQWYPIIEKATSELVHRLAEFPGNDIEKTLKDYLGSVILRIAYGEGIYGGHGEELIQANVEGLSFLNYIMSTFWLVDAVPFLRYIPKWMPGTKFHRVAETARRQTAKIRDWPFELVLEELKNDIVQPSFARQSLEAGYNHDRVKDAVGVFYAAALDTTFIVLCTFVLAMALHPDKQSKAQAEMDSFIRAEGRLPSFDDRKALQYLELLLKELLRWNPPLPFVIGHSNMDEDEYRGMRIPKNSTIFPNVWQLMHDEDVWQDPLEFRPERFAEDVSQGLPDPLLFVFGFGRRICPGKHLADRILYLALVHLLAFFTFELDPRENKPLKAEFATGFFRFVDGSSSLAALLTFQKSSNLPEDMSFGQE